MKKPLYISITVFILIIGFLIWWFSDTQVVKRRTEELTHIFTIKADDGKSARVSKNQDLGELLSRTFSCSIELDSYQRDLQRDDLINAHLYLGQICQSSSVQIGEITIISLNDDSATVQADFSISVQEKGGRSHSESAPATLIWKKTEGGSWRLDEVTLKSS